MWLLGDNMKGQIEGPYLLINKGIMTFGEPFKDMCCAHAIFLLSVNQWILRYFALDFEKFSLSWANQDGEILPYATSLPSLLNKKMWLSLWKGVNKNMRWIWNTPPAAGPYWEGQLLLCQLEYSDSKADEFITFAVMYYFRETVWSLRGSFQRSRPSWKTL